MQHPAVLVRWISADVWSAKHGWLPFWKCNFLLNWTFGSWIVVKSWENPIICCKTYQDGDKELPSTEGDSVAVKERNVCYRRNELYPRGKLFICWFSSYNWVKIVLKLFISLWQVGCIFVVLMTSTLMFFPSLSLASPLLCFMGNWLRKVFFRMTFIVSHSVYTHAPRGRAGT